MSLDVEYVLPVRWRSDERLADLDSYLRWLVDLVPVTVVDGSPSEIFARHADTFDARVRHVAPDPTLPGLNGKAVAVLTALPLARHEKVIIADDDVRYGEQPLREIAEALDRWDLIRPQNYFLQLPWHARWDSARTLINRAMWADFPGTLGLRRSALPSGYSADVLFENLELIRTVRAAGGSEFRANDLLVGRNAPTAKHFWSQRIRQAYDSQGQPIRLVAELLILPLVSWCALKPARLGWFTALAMGVAHLGRMRSAGSSRFAASTPLFAPVWAIERGVCSWIAVGLRIRGGVRYNGRLIRTAAHSRSQLSKTTPRATPERKPS